MSSNLVFGERLSAFLAEPLPIVVGTTRSDGSVQMNPVWYEYRDGLIWLNGGPERGWVKHLERDPRATLFLMNSAQLFRWAQIQTRLVDTTIEGAGEHINQLSHRYTGKDYPGPLTGRLIVRLTPYRIMGGESRQPWDVTQNEA
jgi:PPOX class probable F420-dependent enzyme